MCSILKTRALTYNLQSRTDFMGGCINTRHYGLNSLIYFAPKVWYKIPLKIKNINSLQKFKTEIRKYAPENSYCDLCRPYLQNLGYVELV